MYNFGYKLIFIYYFNLVFFDIVVVVEIDFFEKCFKYFFKFYFCCIICVNIIVIWVVFLEWEWENYVMIIWKYIIWWRCGKWLNYKYENYFKFIIYLDICIFIWY